MGHAKEPCQMALVDGQIPMVEVTFRYPVLHCRNAECLQVVRLAEGQTQKETLSSSSPVDSGKTSPEVPVTKVVPSDLGREILQPSCKKTIV